MDAIARQSDIQQVRAAQGETGRQVQELTRRVVSWERAIFLDLVALSFGNTQLVGRYRPDAEHILVTLDATNGSFNVQLPSAKEGRAIILIFKRVDSTTNQVTITAQSGEYVDGSANLIMGIAHDGFSLISNRVNGWYMDGHLRGDNVVSVTANYVMTTHDDLLVCNSAAAITVTLRAATGTGSRVSIKNIGAGNVTVQGSASNTIDGETSQVLNQWDCMELGDYASGKWEID